MIVEPASQYFSWGSGKMHPGDVACLLLTQIATLFHLQASSSAVPLSPSTLFTIDFPIVLPMPSAPYII
jgi:hypothetical protein